MDCVPREGLCQLAWSVWSVTHAMVKISPSAQEGNCKMRVAQGLVQSNYIVDIKAKKKIRKVGQNVIERESEPSVIFPCAAFFSVPSAN